MTLYEPASNKLLSIALFVVGFAVHPVGSALGSPSVVP